MKLRYHNPNSRVRIWGRAKESELKLIGGKGKIIEQPLGKLPVFKIQSTEGEGTLKVGLGTLLYSFGSNQQIT